MPELPEVETVRNTLKNLLVGQTIQQVDILYPKLVQGDFLAFANHLVGCHVHDIHRYGKYLFFDLGDAYWVSHLRMEGKYYYVDDAFDDLSHVHAVITFQNGKKLLYHDTRKFGRFEWIPKDHYLQYLQSHHLGKEPIDESFDFWEFRNRLAKTHRSVKASLLDQSLLAGLGNIYVDEVLFRAKVHPSQTGNQLATFEMSLLAIAAKETLEKAIALGGTTIRSYTSSLGVSGKFQNELNVHLRQHEPCPHCHTPIQKIKVATRGTYLCPTCQAYRNHQVRVVGITGGIAMGKSTVESLLMEKGFVVLNADFIYKELTKPHQVLYNEIVSTFGTSYCKEDQTLDYQKLARAVFQDQEMRSTLNQIAHPLVKETILADLQRLKQHHQLVFVSVPLLYEAKYEDLFDQIIVVHTTEAVQLSRLMNRNHLDIDAAMKRIQAQDSIQSKLEKADVRIDNSKSITHTKRQL